MPRHGFAVLEEQAFDAERHDRAGFSCGVPELDDYLQRFATQHRRKGISTVFVLVDRAAPSQVLGYYTLSAAEVDGERLSEAERKKLPRYPVPCFRMGRLACRSDQRGRGLGRLLLGCAVERCLKARTQVAAYALIVDAKDEAATAFYRHFGFVPLPGQAGRLLLPAKAFPVPAK